MCRTVMWPVVLCAQVLGKLFGSKSEEVTGEWRKVYNEELRDLCSSLNVIWVAKSRSLRWVGHVACVGRRVMHTECWWGNPNEITCETGT
jgi:hypothetical protein